MRFKPCDRAEFEKRQLCLDFGAAARFVMELAASVKNQLSRFVGNLRRKAERIKPPQQLVLELDTLCQIPLLRPSL